VYNTGCDGQADIVFVVDATNSTTPQNFNNSMNFVYNAVSQLDIEFNATHVALVIVGNVHSTNSSAALTSVGCAPPDILLFDHYNIESLLTTIDTVRRSIVNFSDYAPGNLSSCLLSTVEDVLTQTKGARKYASRAVILVSSGDLIRTTGSDVDQLIELTKTATSITELGEQNTYGTCLSLIRFIVLN
jgi:von Willebrand factor type A domain